MHEVDLDKGWTCLLLSPELSVQNYQGIQAVHLEASERSLMSSQVCFGGKNDLNNQLNKMEEKM